MQSNNVAERSSEGGTTGHPQVSASAGLVGRSIEELIGRERARAERSRVDPRTWFHDTLLHMWPPSINRHKPLINVGRAAFNSNKLNSINFHFDDITSWSW
jgi:hypothetical protein